MKPIRITTGALLSTALLAGTAWSHSPICSCYDNGDDTVTCEGGFSDGSSATGVSIRVVDDRERVLIDGKMDADSVFSFAKPSADFHVVFDAGQNHIVTIFSGDIEE
jgi:hypothetical protein